MPPKSEPPASKSDFVPMGVDLGNTSSCVAVVRTGGVEVVANDQGHRGTPSVVAFTEAEQLVGELAKGQAARNAANTVHDVMTLLGRRWDDPAVQTAVKRWRFQVSRGKGEQTQVDVSYRGEQKSFTPQKLASLLLAELRGSAEALLGGVAKDAVLAVPHDFVADREGAGWMNSTPLERRQALMEAASLAGLRVKQLLSAPLAVALLYGSQHPLQPPPQPDEPQGAAPAQPPPAAQQLLVVDVGGSSTCVAVVQRGAAAAAAGEGAGAESVTVRVASEEYAVRCFVRDEGVGASAVDGAVRAHVLKEVKRRQRVDLGDSARVMARLLSACEAAKLTLSSATQATVTVEADAMDYSCTVSRAALDAAARPLCQAVVALVQRALRQANLAADDVDALLLAGGGARIAAVQTALAALAPTATAHFALAAEESVARGAAAYASMLAGSGAAAAAAAAAAAPAATAAVQTRPVLPRAVALRVGGGGLHVLAHAGTPLPLTRSVALAPPPPDGPPPLLQLVEMAPPPPPEEEGGDDPAAAAAEGRTAMQLRLPLPRAGTTRLRLEVSVDADGALEAKCEAEGGGEGEGGEGDGGAPQLLAEKRAAPRAVADLD